MNASGLRKAGIWLGAIGLLILVLGFWVPLGDACPVQVTGECVSPDYILYSLIVGLFVLTWAVICFAAHAVVKVVRGL